MRLVPKRWHNETWVCSLRGHYVPAALAATLRQQDDALGVDLADGTRLSRCLRCDIWLREPPPSPDRAAYDVIPPIESLNLPRRGKPLQDAILLRLIALDRGLHALLFGSLAIVLFVVEVRWPAIHEWAKSIADGLNGAAESTAQAGSHVFLNRRLESLAELQSGEVRVLIATAAVYAVIEGVEGVFLWKERRWAEYLTAVATVGFIPFEVKELVDRVTALRIGALVLNLLILGWLLWNKRLFGLNGGAAALEDNIDWDEILANPVAPPKTPVEH